MILFIHLFICFNVVKRYYCYKKIFSPSKPSFRYSSTKVLAQNSKISSPKNIFENKLQRSLNFAKLSIGVFVSARSARAVEIDLPECSDAVTVMTNINQKKEIILIGTAHISEDSASLVREIIRNTKPDVVMIELDRKRIGKVSDGSSLSDLGFDLPKQLQAVTSIESSTENLSKTVINPFRGFQSAVSNWVSQSAGALLGS